MKRLKFILMLLWNSPLTIIGIIHALIFTIFGWYTFKQVYDISLVWQVNFAKFPKKLIHLWDNHNSYSMGNVIVIKKNLKISEATLLHELEHVRQSMILGIFYPIFYYLFSFIIRISLNKSHHYFSNPFEVEARRVAKQTIDIEGILEKAKRKGKNENVD